MTSENQLLYHFIILCGFFGEYLIRYQEHLLEREQAAYSWDGKRALSSAICLQL